MGIWGDRWRTEAKNWAFSPIGTATEIIPQKRYVSIMLRRLHIVNAQVGFSRFYGAVEFYGRLPHMSGAPAEFTSITAPSKLRDVQRKDFRNFVLSNKRLLGPVPYVGGDLEMEIGLFTIKSQDLLMPYLELLDVLSRTAGLAFSSVAAPYISAIKSGAAALLRPEGSSSLEIGASVTFNPAQEGTYFAARLSSDDQDLPKFRLDSSYDLVDEKGCRLARVPYLVFSVAQSAAREDWHQIPAISGAYNGLVSSVREQKSYPEIDFHFEHFRRVVLTDPDILSGHGSQIIAWVEENLSAAQRSTKTSRKAQGPTLPALRRLQLAPI